MEKVYSLSLRYILLLLFGIGNLFLFYLVFTPLTVYPVFYLIKSFYPATLMAGTYTAACDLSISLFPFLKGLACMNTTVFFQGYFASIIPACIAGAAYYLLLILNLSTPMSSSQRLKSLFFILSLFLILNIARIFAFAVLFVSKKYAIFDLAHTASWYFGSTILVILIWFANVYLFNIRSIPIYTDIKTMINQIRGNK